MFENNNTSEEQYANGQLVLPTCINKTYQHKTMVDTK